MDLDLKYINEWSMSADNDIYYINGKQYQFDLEKRKFISS